MAFLREVGRQASVRELPSGSRGGLPGGDPAPHPVLNGLDGGREDQKLERFAPLADCSPGATAGGQELPLLKVELGLVERVGESQGHALPDLRQQAPGLVELPLAPPDRGDRQLRMGRNLVVEDALRGRGRGEELDESGDARGEIGVGFDEAPRVEGEMLEGVGCGAPAEVDRGAPLWSG
jgi:hypothetical protein